MLSSNIRYIRRNEKLSQTDFGKLFGVTRGMIDSYEGNRAAPSAELLNKVCNRYNISLNTLTNIDLIKNPGYFTPGAHINNNPEDAEKINSLTEELISELKKRIAEQEKTISILLEKIAKQK